MWKSDNLCDFWVNFDKTRSGVSPKHSWIPLCFRDFSSGSWALLLAEVHRFKTADLVSNPSQNIIIIYIYILHTYNNLYPYMYYIYVYLYIYICINIYAAFAVNSCAGQDLLLQDVFWDVHQGCSPSHLPPTTYPSFLSTCGSSKMSRANCLNMSEYEGNTTSVTI
jgi:hypothetical protein